VKNAGIQGIFAEKPAAKADRRISVAPMMDWTDTGNLARYLIW
jgi:hypothetical protein